MENRKETITSAKTRNQRNAERRINASSLKSHLLHYRVCFYSCQLVARFPINELHTRRKEDNHSYLEPISQCMQKPIGGRSVMALFTTKNKACHTKVQPIYRGGIACSKRISPSKTPFKTLIPDDTTLISAIFASNRIQQHRIRYPKRDATPHPHGCGVKGELSRTTRSSNDTMHRQNNNDATT